MSVLDALMVGDTLSHVYFPTAAIVSLLYVMPNGESAKIAVVDSKGVIGVSLFTSGRTCPGRHAPVLRVGHRSPSITGYLRFLQKQVMPRAYVRGITLHTGKLPLFSSVAAAATACRRRA